MTTPAYCTRADLALVGLSPNLYAGHAEVTTTTLDTMIGMRSSFMDDYLAQFFKLPLVSWGPSLSIVCAQLVSWDVMCLIGHDPDQAATSVWRDRRDEAMTAIQAIAKRGSPSIVDSTPTTKIESAPAMSSEPKRGW